MSERETDRVVECGPGRLPLATLLSQALVAFTIELDNEFEHQMPHRTTNHGSSASSDRVPWLVSMVMWANCMRFVPADGIASDELGRRARIPAAAMRTMLRRMSDWWGYLVVGGGTAAGSARGRRSAPLVRPTSSGRRAQIVWEPLAGGIEDRWRERFGRHAIDDARSALSALLTPADAELPDHLPIGEQSRAWRIDPVFIRPRASESPAAPDLALPALLSKLLLRFTLDVERDSELALALGANVVRALDQDGVPVRDLSRRTGVARMGIENSLSILERRGYVSIGPDPAGGRSKSARLTAKGRAAHDGCRERLREVERSWTSRHGERLVRATRESLELLVGSGTAADSPLFRGLEPYSGGWRSELPRPTTLPHHPMISHRGGFPDGS